MLRRIIPIFWFGPAINMLRDGDVGFGIALLSLSAFIIIVNAFFDDYDERERQRKR